MREQWSVNKDEERWSGIFNVKEKNEEFVEKWKEVERIRCFKKGEKYWIENENNGVMMIR